MDVCQAHCPCLSGVKGDFSEGNLMLTVFFEKVLIFFSNVWMRFSNAFLPDSWAQFEKVTDALWEGFGMTITLFILTLLFALPLGLIISFGSMSSFKPLKYLTKVIVWMVRGTPLMLQIFIVFFTPGLVFEAVIPPLDISFFGAELSLNWRFMAALTTFVINYACYFSEIFRGGIESISVGQYEAGQVLGMTRSQTFFKVVLLQVVKRILAPISNEVITLVKDTSLVRVISVIEIIKVAERYSSQGLIWPLFFTGVYYLAFNGILTLLFGYFEKKLSYFRS